MKTFFSILIAFLLSSFIYSESSNFIEDNYEEFTLENGLQLYVLEDFSSAPVRIEYTVHAGISSSSQNNTGFFSLYSRLFKYNFSSPNYKSLVLTSNRQYQVTFISKCTNFSSSRKYSKRTLVYIISLHCFLVNDKLF